MKTFHVFYDVKSLNGLLVEHCLTVYKCVTKHDAIVSYQEFAPKNAIFRCVKAPVC